MASDLPEGNFYHNHDFKRKFMIVDNRWKLCLLGWEKHVSKSTGRTYYLNTYTKQSQWEIPTEKASKANQVRCSHLLIKHKDSRRPSSWREENITRTKEEALEILQSRALMYFVCVEFKAKQAFNKNLEIR